MARHLLSPRERQEYGVIVTAIVDGEIRVRQGYGGVREALDDAVWALERLGRIDQVLSISTPETVYRDVLIDELGHRSSQQAAIDAMLLGRIGRSDLAAQSRWNITERQRLARTHKEDEREERTGRRWRMPRRRKK